MIKRSRVFQRRTYWMAFPMLVVLALVSFSFVGTDRVQANHPVLVEGNCDSPVPGTTLVAPGTCGDFDGDGRIGTAEDTDGADRIFGTINAAIGPGTGAAAGTGANHNGTVTIVANGRFAENVYIGQNVSGPGFPGAADPGNVTLQAAPGVEAQIDAVLQGDSAANNNARQNGIGIAVVYTATLARGVTLRNLTVRNFAHGIQIFDIARVNIDNCRIENNFDFGVRMSDSSTTTITNSRVFATGARIGSIPGSSATAVGVSVEQGATVRIVDTIIAQNFGKGVRNLTASAANVVLYKVGIFYNNSGNIEGGVTTCTDTTPCM